jgi:hypothetical protein
MRTFIVYSTEQFRSSTSAQLQCVLYPLQFFDKSVSALLGSMMGCHEMTSEGIARHVVHVAVFFCIPEVDWEQCKPTERGHVDLVASNTCLDYAPCIRQGCLEIFTTCACVTTETGSAKRTPPDYVT